MNLDILWTFLFFHRTPFTTCQCRLCKKKPSLASSSTSTTPSRMAVACKLAVLSLIQIIFLMLQKGQLIDMLLIYRSLTPSLAVFTTMQISRTLAVRNLRQQHTAISPNGSLDSFSPTTSVLIVTRTSLPASWVMERSHVLLVWVMCRPSSSTNIADLLR
jgi:hypothetical protein